MSHANKKQRHKIKREAKRREARRRNSVSPVKRLAESTGDTECWMSDDFHELGQAQVFVYKRAGTLSGIACFLIDRGVVGLKDAWVRMNIDHDELDAALDKSDQEGISMRRATLDEARKLVAGGLRWAHDNGMRLPKEWPKTTSFIGSLDAWQGADVSAFVMEFAGHPEDLRRRLIGEPFETYIQRDDIDFEFSDDAPYMDQETGDYHNNDSMFDTNLSEQELEEMASDIPVEVLDQLALRFIPAAAQLVSQTADWLAMRDESPSPELSEAWRSMMLAAMLSKTAMPDAPEDEIADFGYDLLKDMSSRVEASRYPEHHRAVGQVLDHLTTDPLLMQKAVLEFGLAGDGGQRLSGTTGDND